MSFFDSDVVRAEMTAISEIQDDVYKNVFKFPSMDKEEKLEHVGMLETLLEKQKILYARLSLSDDPEAKEMKQRIVDSATMMNKGLELIEAHFLFNFPHEKIDVVIHPESIIHSCVEYVDGSILSQMGTPDMRTPISYTLAYPTRIPTNVERLDLSKVGKLTFFSPRFDKFPCLGLAYESLKIQKSDIFTFERTQRPSSIPTSLDVIMIF